MHLCACIFVCLYVNKCKSATTIRVELEHWASGCMQWICLSREFTLSPTQWRLLFIYPCVNHPHVSDQTLKRVWQVCLSKIAVWCVYESLCEVEQKTHCGSHCTQGHMYGSVCVFVSFWFNSYFGCWEFCEQQWTVQLCQQWTPHEGLVYKLQRLKNSSGHNMVCLHILLSHLKLLDSFCKRFVFTIDIRCYDNDEKQKTDVVNSCKSVSAECASMHVLKYIF